MIRHLFRLVWNRKRANALLVVEIAISFLVLFGVVLLATFYVDNARRPIGFDPTDVWVVGIDVKQESDDTWDEATVVTTRNLALAVRDLPEVESVAAALSTPYSFSYATSSVTVDGGREVEYQRAEVTDELADVLKLDVERGRWLDRDDVGADVTPVVVNARFARELFGDEDPVGRIVSTGRDANDRFRVVGVVSEYRKDGELSAGVNSLFERADLNDPKLRPPRNLAVRVRPGTGPEFEQKLIGTLQAAGKDWSYEVKPLVELRDDWIRIAMTPLVLGGVIAAFLLLMVGLGLMGVLWQNVAQRTREIGLRRVQGATAGDICLQFLGELLVVTSVALAAGALVVGQLPLLGLTGPVSGTVFAWSIIIAAGLIYALTAVCGLYPSWMATRIAPVEALRYE